MRGSTAKKAIVIMNLGSPDSTTVKDVRKYLNEFLMDKRVIDMPYLSRFLLVKALITPFRAPRSAEAYRSIWTKDGSPLIVITRQLADSIESKIAQPVAIAMRYGTPSPKDAFDDLKSKFSELEEVLLIPLYPHYAASSFETAVEYAKEIHQKNKYPFRLSILKPYFNAPEYVHALAESIKPYVQHDY